MTADLVGLYRQHAFPMEGSRSDLFLEIPEILGKAHDEISELDLRNYSKSRNANIKTKRVSHTNGISLLFAQLLQIQSLLLTQQQR